MFIFVQNTNYSFSDNGGNSVDYLRPRVFGLQLSSSVREKKKRNSERNLSFVGQNIFLFYFWVIFTVLVFVTHFASFINLISNMI
jgi:hypothetical protein